MIILLISPLPHVKFFIPFTYYTKDEHGDFQEFSLNECYSDFVLAFMFIRVYFVLKWAFDQSIYTDAFSKKLCNDYGFYPGFRFILKSKFINSPQSSILILFIVTVLILSYMFRIFEIYYALHPYTETFFNKET